MKEVILTIQSEGIKGVIFRAQVTRFIMKVVEHHNKNKSFELYAYNESVCIWKRNFHFFPAHLVDQIRNYSVPLVEVYESGEITVQQWQDLYDLSK